MTLDVTGQRMGALLFRGLTRLDAELEPQPDLAESWSFESNGRVWKFKVRPGLTDHAGRAITADSVAQCLEEYRAGKPISPVGAAFTDWKTTRVQGDQVVIELATGDPYFPRNASALRYFTLADGTSCREPAGAEVIGSGLYQMVKWNPTPDDEIALVPRDPSVAPVRFLIVRDELSRAMHLLNGEADAVQNGLSLTKERWIQKEHGNRFVMLERDGVNVSYLAFNLRDPILARKEVRQAIAAAIDVESVIRNKLFGFATRAGSFVSPLLAESFQAGVPAYDPASAERLLDQAGLNRGKDGVRLRLKYKTTPVREGYEMALLYREMLRKVGIELTLDVVEPAVFLASVRKGHFQLYSSRWVGVSDGSILHRTLHSGQKNNRAGYRDEAMNALLEKAMGETDLARRKDILKQVQVKMAEDLPYLPLWYWKNALIVRKELLKDGAGPVLSLSGAFEPMIRIRKNNETNPFAEAATARPPR